MGNRFAKDIITDYAEWRIDTMSDMAYTDDVGDEDIVWQYGKADAQQGNGIPR